jgi:hypothetical protein
MNYYVIFVKPTNFFATLTFESQPTLRQEKGNELKEWGKGIPWFKCTRTHVWKCKGWSPNIPTRGIGSPMVFYIFGQKFEEPNFVQIKPPLNNYKCVRQYYNEVWHISK